MKMDTKFVIQMLFIYPEQCFRVAIYVGYQKEGFTIEHVTGRNFREINYSYFLSQGIDLDFNF